MNETVARIRTLFPDAAPYDEMLDNYFHKLKVEFGLNVRKNVAAYSLCPDELNNPVIEKIRSLFGNTFSLGGITGYPFTGVTGFNAFGDHIPDNGTAFIFYGPHMGINAARNGYVHRIGQERDTLSCGAALGAYQQLVEANGKMSDINHSDYQQWRVMQMILPHYATMSKVSPELKLIDIVFEESRNFVLQQAVRIKERFNANRIFLLGALLLNTPLYMPDYLQVRYSESI